KSITRRDLQEAIGKRLRTESRRRITRVINATGIIVHTNLGRAPLAEELFDAIKQTVTGYGNIEFDLTSGKRGQRGAACEHYLALLAGAEAGTVVNNNAAALFLILNTLANRKKVAISRGELVQIGGGFRILDILRRAGGRLIEVGTTNITTLRDYEDAIKAGATLLLKVHKSNFIQAGFTEEVDLPALVTLARNAGVFIVNDLGSGGFLPTRKLLGYDEPTVRQSVRAGADLTCFSGDKLLGGVQAGLIVGNKALIDKLKKNPLFRTLRVDKIVFAALEKLLSIYLNGTQNDDIKLWKLVSTPESELYQRGQDILKELGKPSGLSVEGTHVYMGGGALPQQALPSVAIVFDSKFSARKLLQRFREFTPPIIGRIENERFLLDLKAVDEADLPYVTACISRILDEG
ncbi:MAG: L-seryl-tRNA(Sec) selenium transferase, partial [Candidatus Zixiibacteriota bacterium]